MLHSHLHLRFSHNQKNRELSVMNKYLLSLVCTVGLMSFSSSVLATDLVDVYRQALCTDPPFRAAYSTMKSTQEGLAQSIAGVLPTITGEADTNGNYIHILNIAGLPSNLTPLEEEQAGLFVRKYHSENYNLNLTQPIINFTNWMKILQNNFVYKEAAATYCAATQDLIIRVAKAYFDVLQAQDNLVYTEAQKAANARQLEQTKQRYNVGLDAITSVYNALASYDATLAEEIAAENTLANTREVLRRITGIYYCSIEGLKIELPLIKPCPLNIDQWTTFAGQFNQTYLSKHYASDAARAVIKANFGGHIPNLNLIGSASRNNGANLGTNDQNQASIGLQLNVPIFQGGFVNSQVRQAQYDYSTSISNMADAYRQAVLDTRENFNNVMSGISKITADRAAIVSAQSSVDSTEESFKVGTRTIVDVLLAQQQLFQARTNYAQDEYTYLLNTLQLKQAAGILSPRDLCQINAWLHGPDRRNVLAQSEEQTHLQPSPELTNPTLDNTGPVLSTTGGGHNPSQSEIPHKTSTNTNPSSPINYPGLDLTTPPSSSIGPAPSLNSHPGQEPVSTYAPGTATPNTMNPSLSPSVQTPSPNLGPAPAPVTPTPSSDQGFEPKQYPSADSQLNINLNPIAKPYTNTNPPRVPPRQQSPSSLSPSSNNKESSSTADADDTDSTTTNSDRHTHKKVLHTG